jgi:peroxiredoxin Q/BCP
MKYLIVIGLVFIVGIIILATSNKKEKLETLEIGDKVPVFTLLDQDGNTFNITDYIGTKNLVIYFYPKDDTPGCTKEACGFRDEFEAFSDLDALVIGISVDSPESHRKFIEKYQLPFTLLSDEDDEVRKQFGVNGNYLGLIPGRVTFVVDKQGIIQFVFDSQSKATKHVEETQRVLIEIND